MNYPVIIVPIIVGVIAQSTKFLLSILKHRKIEFKYLFGPGHMPSAHTAFVVSLTTTVAHRDGIFSSVFAASFVLAYITVYDAFAIRIHIGRNGEIINKLVSEIPGIERKSYPRLKERVGHRPLEILAGAVFGLVFTVLLIWIMNRY